MLLFLKPLLGACFGSSARLISSIDKNKNKREGMIRYFGHIYKKTKNPECVFALLDIVELWEGETGAR
jgi:hypothetical protein